MLKLKWCAWGAVFCSFSSFANSRSSEDAEQVMSSFTFSVGGADVQAAESSAQDAPW